MDLTKILLPLPLLAAGAIAATGCGTTNSDAQTPPTTTTPKTPTTTPAPAPTAKAATASGPISVDLTEFKITPSATSAATGKVTFKATNNGKIPHEMVVLKTDKPADQLGKPGAARVAETGHQGEVEDLKPGKTGSVTLDLKPGHYVLVCNLPGHWAGGMRADFTVR